MTSLAVSALSALYGTTNKPHGAFHMNYKDKRDYFHVYGKINVLSGTTLQLLPQTFKGRRAAQSVSQTTIQFSTWARKHVKHESMNENSWRRWQAWNALSELSNLTCTRQNFFRKWNSADESTSWNKASNSACKHHWYALQYGENDASNSACKHHWYALQYGENDATHSSVSHYD